MKLNRNSIVIAISSIALFMVLIIQVTWIVRTAEIKEALFNEKANMVLSRTAEALSSDKETCRKIESYVDQNIPSVLTAKLGTSEAQKLDSLFSYFIRFYNFPIEYSFEVIKPGSASKQNEKVYQNYVYIKPLEEAASKSGLELKLIFPEKSQFIIAEMGTLFITSVLLILIVLVLFWRTILSLMKEKTLSEHTSDFLNNMTHEFKTPLANIALAGKMIMKDPSLKQGDKIEFYSSIIRDENEKLRLQVEQVLSMTALERGEIPLQKTELDFHELIHHTIKCMNLQIEHKEGNLKLDLAAEHVVVMGDKTHLTNAMCNLIDNALKYAKDKPQIFIQSSNKENFLRVVVSDEGIGIKKEYQKKVFDKFFRVPTGDVHDVKGFGLGLAYIKKIVELHGGTIELHSELGKGTMFTLMIPHG